MRRGHFVGATLAVALLSMGSARAENFDFLLRGTFSSTGTQTCLISIGGFNADLTPNAFSFVTTTSTIATAVFNGDGTGSDTGQEVSLTFPPVASASSDRESFNLKYHVNADRSVTEENDGPITGQILTGVRAGQTFTIAAAAPATGSLSEDRRSLTLAPANPVIETVAFSGGRTEQRICSRSRVLIKVEEDIDHDAAGER